jgi:hypothetical protein
MLAQSQTKTGLRMGVLWTNLDSDAEILSEVAKVGWFDTTPH